jgi:hypothetical protein
MNIADTILTTDRLGAPADWNHERDGQCLTLPVVREKEEGGYSTISSFWLPTEEELARLNAGDPICLTIYGSSHPVVSVHLSHTVTKEHITHVF